MTALVNAKFKEALINGSANTSLNGSGTTGVYAALIDEGAHAYSSSDQFYSDISAGIVGTPQELTSKTFTNGLFDAADSTFPTTSGASCEAIVFYVKNAGANTTWRLVAYENSGATGLPVTPNGGDINIVWNASGIIQF
jgi:hypothetical protein